MTQYVYLFHTREFFNSNQPIYKIGKTTKPNFTRFSNYPKGSVMLFQSSCRNCHELEMIIITLFTSKYVRKIDFGREYFEGDQSSMIGDLCDIVKNEGILQDVIVSTVIDEVIIQEHLVSNVIEEETIQDIIVEEVKQEIIESNVTYEETIQDVIVEETIQDVIVEETIQDVIVEETIQDVTDEETIQDVIVEENESNDMRVVLCTFVSNVFEEEDVDEEEKEKMLNRKNKHYCTPCGYPCNSKSNLTKHQTSKKHKDKIENPDAVIVGGFKCKNCDKIYKSNPGLWAHNKKCKPAVAPLITPDAVPEVDLHAKIDNLERIMREMAKNLVS